MQNEANNRQKYFKCFKFTKNAKRIKQQAKVVQVFLNSKKMQKKAQCFLFKKKYGFLQKFRVAIIRQMDANNEAFSQFQFHVTSTETLSQACV